MLVAFEIKLEADEICAFFLNQVNPRSFVVNEID
jgi:hypothetical protein